MITKKQFGILIRRLKKRGYHSDVEWSENLSPPDNAECFAFEAINVICNSGMKNSTADKLFRKVRNDLTRHNSARGAFGHKEKIKAINKIWRKRSALYKDFKTIMCVTPEWVRRLALLSWCETLPWIGNTTKYHLAKSCGIDVAKPDVHLRRLAALSGETVEEMCSRLAHVTGYRIATVDVVLWRACAIGLMNSKTGRIHNIRARQ